MHSKQIPVFQQGKNLNTHEVLHLVNIFQVLFYMLLYKELTVLSAHCKRLTSPNPMVKIIYSHQGCSFVINYYILLLLYLSFYSMHL